MRKPRLTDEEISKLRAALDRQSRATRERMLNEDIKRYIIAQRRAGNRAV